MGGHFPLGKGKAKGQARGAGKGGKAGKREVQLLDNRRQDRSPPRSPAARKATNPKPIREASEFPAETQNMISKALQNLITVIQKVPVLLQDLYFCYNFEKNPPKHF